jgi:hypothetical protein
MAGVFHLYCEQKCTRDNPGINIIIAPDVITRKPARQDCGDVLKVWRTFGIKHAGTILNKTCRGAQFS